MSQDSPKTYVGASVRPLSETTLRQLTQQPNSYYFYFLCWPHTTSGIITELPRELSPEGRMFNAERELRWQRKGKGESAVYDILALSRTDDWPDKHQSLESLSGNWRCSDRPAALFPKTETRFSGRIRYPGVTEIGEDKFKIEFGQRYFFDANTSTVHFVALTADLTAKKTESPAEAVIA